MRTALPGGSTGLLHFTWARPALAEGFSPGGTCVTKVITELGILSRSGPGEELQLTAVHPGADVETVVEGTGWSLQVPEH